MFLLLEVMVGEEKKKKGAPLFSSSMPSKKKNEKKTEVLNSERLSLLDQNSRARPFSIELAAPCSLLDSLSPHQ